MGATLTHLRALVLAADENGDETYVLVLQGADLPPGVSDDEMNRLRSAGAIAETDRPATIDDEDPERAAAQREAAAKAEADAEAAALQAEKDRIAAEKKDAAATAKRAAAAEKANATPADPAEAAKQARLQAEKTAEPVKPTTTGTAGQ